ncbi:MAG: protein-L-isoaspartate O-methyltransferase [bacterium]|nr:protein-L-isoaspartate O-methyltransferase [bacterium]
MTLVDSLIKEGWLKTPRIIAAFRKINRANFLPESLKGSAEVNEALPIGYGQTISQPLVVAFMLELLQPQEGDRVLDIGSGSGWTSALLGELVGDSGRVTALEIIPELRDLGEKNAGQYDFIKKGIVQFILSDASKGYEKGAPYNRILASASAKGEIPNIWKKQLKPRGAIVAPVESSIWQILKTEEGKFEEIEYPGFIFVPLIET